MSASFVIAALSIGLSILTGIAVWAKNSKQRSDVIYAITSFLYVLLGFFNFMSTLTNGQTKLIFARLVMASTAISMALTYYLIITLRQYGLQKDKLITAKRIIFVTITIIVVLISLTHFVISDISSETSSAYLSFGYGMLVFVAYLTGVSALILVTLVRNILNRQLDGATRSQFMYLLVGYLPVFLIAPVTGVYLPVVNSDLRFIALTPVYSAFFVMMVGYAMVKHKLFDIRLYVVRFLAFSLASVILSALYIAPLVYIFCAMAGVRIGSWAFVGTVASFSIVAAYYGRIHQWFRGVTSKIFFQDIYDSTALLAQLNRDLISTVDIEKMLANTTGLITSTMKPEYCYYVLRNMSGDGYRFLGYDTGGDEADVQAVLRNISDTAEDVIAIQMLDQTSRLYKTATKMDIAGIVKLKKKTSSHTSLLGFMVLGVKKSGNVYSVEDLQVLRTIAGALTIAIQNALQYEEIHLFNKTLQGKVEDATAQLRATNSKLKQIDASKDEFISMASHQLRTPLTSIKGYISMLLDGDLGKVTPQQHKALEEAYNSSQRMVYLIGDFLNLSRLQTGKFEIDLTQVSLPRIIKEEIAQLQATAETRGIALQYAAPTSFPMVGVDETKIRQVMMNFIDNAIYYAKPTGGEITVSLTQESDEVVFRVVDNGIGIPANEQHHLFTKFYRAGNARKARPDGTGIGLYMAKKVIIAHGGEIIFESKAGQGSTFGFRLPLSPHIQNTP